FLQFADFIEQARPLGVVEILAGQFPGRLAQSVQHVRQKAPGRGIDTANRLGNRKTALHVTSWARRTPLNCQRASGGKKLRYVVRAWDRGVAHDAPRKTSWLHMNLPLYSPSAPNGG